MIEHASSTLKTIVCDFTQRFIIYQKPSLLFKKLTVRFSDFSLKFYICVLRSNTFKLACETF